MRSFIILEIYSLCEKIVFSIRKMTLLANMVSCFIWKKEEMINWSNFDVKIKKSPRSWMNDFMGRTWAIKAKEWVISRKCKCNVLVMFYLTLYRIFLFSHQNWYPARIISNFPNLSQYLCHLTKIDNSLETKLHLSILFI